MTSSTTSNLSRFYSNIISSYTGTFKNNKYNGNGRYIFPNSVIYEGQFVDGHFHGNGSLKFPNKGIFVAEWEYGKAVQGAYIFNDQLEYKDTDWDYCTEENRKFCNESKLDSYDPNQITPTLPVAIIPLGTYDLLDSYYDPKDCQIYSYEGDYLRTPLDDESKWILENARYYDTDDNIIDKFTKVRNIENKENIQYE